MPRITAAEPSFGQIVHNMSKMMDQLQKGFFSFCSNETWTPAVNLYENDTMYIVCVDLAGVDKEKIDVVVVENRLRLRGQRHAPLPPAQMEAGSPAGRLRVHLMEIDHGTFRREVQLPDDVAKEEVRASYQNGMLWVELPKQARAAEGGGQKAEVK
jgi:HSP20 family protein